LCEFIFKKLSGEERATWIQFLSSS
jgi:hypothetical protein